MGVELKHGGRERFLPAAILNNWVADVVGASP